MLDTTEAGFCGSCHVLCGPLLYPTTRNGSLCPHHSQPGETKAQKGSAAVRRPSHLITQGQGSQEPNSWVATLDRVPHLLFQDRPFPTTLGTDPQRHRVTTARAAEGMGTLRGNWAVLACQFRARKGSEQENPRFWARLATSP